MRIAGSVAPATVRYETDWDAEGCGRRCAGDQIFARPIRREFARNFEFGSGDFVRQAGGASQPVAIVHRSLVR